MPMYKIVMHWKRGEIRGAWWRVQAPNKVATRRMVNASSRAIVTLEK